MAMLRDCGATPQIFDANRLRSLTDAQFADLIAWEDVGRPVLDWPGWRLP